MPQPTSARPQKDEKWVVVAEYMVDTDADICVATLKGSRIPVVRLPVMSAASMSRSGVLEPIRVLVPPDREAEPRELLDQGQ